MPEALDERARAELLDRVPLSRLITLVGQLVTMAWDDQGDPPLGPNERRVLLTLHLRGASRASTVATLSGVRASTLSNVSRRLVHDGLLEELPDGGRADGRTRYLTLTGEGQRRVADLLARTGEVEDRALAPLDERARADLRAALTPVAAALLDRLVAEGRLPRP